MNVCLKITWAFWDERVSMIDWWVEKLEYLAKPE
jgi:hypothetical protein